jgi:putative membrane protein
MPASSSQKHKIALYTALAFHVSGFIAIGLLHVDLFVQLTPVNLLVCLALVLYTQEKINAGFLVFTAFAFIVGFMAEYIGVNTGYLFGDYSYGTVLGVKWKGVPLMIGVQWIVTMYCVGVAMHMLQERFMKNPMSQFHRFPQWWKGMSLVIDGALLAVVFDWVIEPVAVHLGYWTWHQGDIPFFNYASWYVVSLAILFVFHKMPFPKANLFAIHLLLIQFMFFLLLRTAIKFGW